MSSTGEHKHEQKALTHETANILVEEMIKSGSTILKIPNNYTSIQVGALTGFNQIESLYIPDTVDTIEPNAISSLQNLKLIVLPENITAVDDNNILCDCYKLRYIICPDELTLPDYMKDENARDIIKTSQQSVRELGIKAYDLCPLSVEAVCVTTTDLCINGNKHRDINIYMMFGITKENASPTTNILRSIYQDCQQQPGFLALFKEKLVDSRKDSAREALKLAFLKAYYPFTTLQLLATKRFLNRENQKIKIASHALKIVSDNCHTNPVIAALFKNTTEEKEGTVTVYSSKDEFIEIPKSKKSTMFPNYTPKNQPDDKDDTTATCKTCAIS